MFQYGWLDVLQVEPTAKISFSSYLIEGYVMVL